MNSSTQTNREIPSLYNLAKQTIPLPENEESAKTLFIQACRVDDRELLSKAMSFFLPYQVEVRIEKGVTFDVSSLDEEAVHALQTVDRVYSGYFRIQSVTIHKVSNQKAFSKLLQSLDSLEMLKLDPAYALGVSEIKTIAKEAKKGNLEKLKLLNLEYNIANSNVSTYLEHVAQLLPDLQILKSERAPIQRNYLPRYYVGW